MATYEINYVRKKTSDSDVKNINRSKDAVDYLLTHCYSGGDFWREKCFVLYVNKNRDVIGHLLISMGGSFATTFDKKLIIKGALDTMATSLILCHNHPDGNAKPGNNDMTATNDLRKACSVFDLQLLDHIVLGEKEYFSFAEEIPKRYTADQKKLMR